MRIAVLSSPTSWYVRDLQRAAGSLHQIEPLPFTQIHSTIGRTTEIGVTRNEAVQRVTEFDLVLIRTMPPGSLEQVVFRMDVLMQLQKLGTPTLNPPKAIEAAVDKYLTLARLQQAGFDVPRTETSQTIDDAMAGFARLGGDVVVKPLFGSEGRGIARIQDEAIALRTFKLLVQLGAVIYQQEFVEHEGFDIRLLVIGRDVFGMRRRNELDWRTNVSRGAKAEAIEVDDGMIEQAIRAAQAVGAKMAGIDLLPARDGRSLAIEVNAVPGWRALARAHDIDVAQKVLAFCSQYADEY